MTRRGVFQTLAGAVVGVVTGAKQALALPLSSRLSMRVYDPGEFVRSCADYVAREPHRPHCIAQMAAGWEKGGNPITEGTLLYFPPNVDPETWLRERRESRARRRAAWEAAHPEKVCR